MGMRIVKGYVGSDSYAEGQANYYRTSLSSTTDDAGCVDYYAHQMADTSINPTRSYMEKGGGLCYTRNAKWEGAGNDWLKSQSPGRAFRLCVMEGGAGGLGLAFGKNAADATTPLVQLQPLGTDSVSHVWTSVAIGTTQWPEYRMGNDNPSSYARIYEPGFPATLAPSNIIVAWASFEVNSGVITIRESYGIASAVLQGSGLLIQFTLTHAMVHIYYGYLYGGATPNDVIFNRDTSTTTTHILRLVDSANTVIDMDVTNVAGTFAIIGQQG